MDDFYAIAKMRDEVSDLTQKRCNDATQLRRALIECDQLRNRLAEAEGLVKKIADDASEDIQDQLYGFLAASPAPANHPAEQEGENDA